MSVGQPSSDQDIQKLEDLEDLLPDGFMNEEDLKEAERKALEAEATENQVADAQQQAPVDFPDPEKRLEQDADRQGQVCEQVSKESTQFTNTEQCDEIIIKDPNELNNIKYEKKGEYKYNEEILKKEEKKIGSGFSGAVFRLLNSKNNYSGFVVKEFKPQKGKEDPEITFVREHKDGIIKDCNLIHSKILPETPQNDLPPVNFMVGVQGDLRDFRPNQKMKIENQVEFLNIAKRVLEMLICLECNGLRYTDLKDMNILYSCIPRSSEGDSGIKVYMGDTGSIIEHGSDSSPIHTHRPFWLLNWYKAVREQMNPLFSVWKKGSEKDKIKDFKTSGINSEPYVIFTFGILLIELFKSNDSSLDILYKKHHTSGKDKNGKSIIGYYDTLEGKDKKGKQIPPIIINRLNDIEGRFDDDSQNENIMNIIKTLIKYEWWWYPIKKDSKDALKENNWHKTLKGIKKKNR